MSMKKTPIVPPDYVTSSEEFYDKAVDRVTMRRLLDLIDPYRALLLLAVLMMIATSAAAAAGPYFVKLAVDGGIEAGNAAVLRYAILAYLLTAIVQWVLIYHRVNLMARVGHSIIYDLRKKIFAHLQRLSLGFYSRYSVGRVVTRAINDVETLREFLTWAVLAITRDLFTLFFIVVIMLQMNMRLALLTFSVLPLMVAATVVFRRVSRRYYRKVRAAVSWVNSVLAENVNGVRVVQAFARQRYNYEQFRDYVNRYHFEQSVAAARVSSVFGPTIDFLGSLAT
ncbi:MAG: ABC transporter transmembrane domain-containing protein, partial [Anaerolineales bacterium]|nr:ABC transporter transmembrane domain-containing protein [Anaerolineales bacterium]MDW8227435.1 ABC transporter transmembrane domain-containing protein [Anaerolineales bacterium]